MNSGIIWHSLIPSTMGEATVTVRLEDVEGNLLSGKVLTVQVRSDLLTRIRMTTGALFMIGAGLAITFSNYSIHFIIIGPLVRFNYSMPLRRPWSTMSKVMKI